MTDITIDSSIDLYAQTEKEALDRDLYDKLSRVCFNLINAFGTHSHYLKEIKVSVSRESYLPIGGGMEQHFQAKFTVLMHEPKGLAVWADSERSFSHTAEWRGRQYEDFESRPALQGLLTEAAEELDHQLKNARGKLVALEQIMEGVTVARSPK